jgi:hypothetical protein
MSKYGKGKDDADKWADDAKERYDDAPKPVVEQARYSLRLPMDIYELVQTEVLPTLYFSDKGEAKRNGHRRFSMNDYIVGLVRADVARVMAEKKPPE